MAFLPLVALFGWSGLWLGAAMSVPLGVALALGDGEQVSRFSYALLWVLFVAILLLAVTRGAGGRASAGAHTQKAQTPQHLLWASGVVWFGLPLWGALPFWGYGGLNFGEAWFEALSAFTTTGASLLGAPESQAASVVLWRSLLAGGGGVWTLTFCLSVLVPLGVGGLDAKRHPKQESSDVAMRENFWSVLRLFGAVAVVGAVLLALSGQGWLAAVSLALTALASAGAAPFSGDLAAAVSPSGMVVVMVLLGLGSLSFPLWYMWPRLGKFKNAALWRDGEWRGFMVWALVVCGGSAWLLGEGALVGAAAGLNLVATGGFHIGEARLPLTWVVVATLIGGMSLSTAGGVKFVRVAVGVRSVLAELHKMMRPHGIFEPTLGGHELTAPRRTAVWAYFAAWVLLVAVALILGSLVLPFGEDFGDVLRFVVGALNNVDWTSLDGEASEVSGLGLVVAGILMVAGRLEILLFLLLFYPLLWRRAPWSSR